MSPHMDRLPLVVEAWGVDEVVFSEGLCFGTVALVVEMTAGAVVDGANAGAVSLAFQMMERGTQALDRASFHEALDRLGADLSVSVGRTRVRFTLACFVDEFEAAVDLLLDAIQRPRDAHAELRSLRNEIAESIELQLEEPSGVLARMSPLAMWPHAAEGRPIEGNRRSRGRVRHATLERVRREVRAHPMRLGVAADAPEALRPTLRRLHAALRDEVAAVHPPRRAPMVSFEGVLAAAAFPEVEQSDVRIAFDAPPANDPDWPALLVYNAAFALGFSSPLPRAIRADAGLSYVVDAHFERDALQSLLLMELAPRADEAARTVALARETSAAFADTLRACDLRAVTTQLAGMHRIGLETPQQRLATALALLRRGSPVDEMWTLIDSLEAVEHDDLERVRQRYGFEAGPPLILFAGGRGADEPAWRERFPTLERRTFELPALI